ncbi:DUF4911 domain-containing protein [Succinispira mobilis]|uniref:DUF4911 domain-containing protein n=1 Tax=Succinispira mobilis TaxID=78120 RepID=UPI00036425BD|nr:DUF4911 domain-containing protein [Succinispira mobilis]
MSKEQCLIRAIVPKEKIGFTGWIFEGYEHVGLVSTIDSRAGEILIRTTSDLYEQAEKILQNLPFQIEIL